jgi:hypothetical protein
MISEVTTKTPDIYAYIFKSLEVKHNKKIDSI